MTTPVTGDDMVAGFAALREVEVAWLAGQLSDSIANLGYPVGMGMAPHPDQIKKAATALFERYAKMIEMAHATAALRPVQERTEEDASPANLREALERMTQAFKPFTMKLLGGERSSVRLEQQEQIEAHKQALAALAAQTTAGVDTRPPSLPGREAVARIIEPTAYHLRDELAKEESSGFPDRQSAELLAGRQIDIALAKADAILSLTKGTGGTCTCGGDDDQPASHHDISCPRALSRTPSHE